MYVCLLDRIEEWVQLKVLAAETERATGQAEA
jgi:hypothetical protein